MFIYFQNLLLFRRNFSFKHFNWERGKYFFAMEDAKFQILIEDNSGCKTKTALGVFSII